jgi:hypothetical protein
MATALPIKPMGNATTYTCTRKGNDVRCECGGQLAIGGTVHPLADMGFGFVGGKFKIERKYSKRVIGYSAFCFACRKEGTFLFAK